MIIYYQKNERTTLQEESEISRDEILGLVTPTAAVEPAGAPSAAAAEPAAVGRRRLRRPAALLRHVAAEEHVVVHPAEYLLPVVRMRVRNRHRVPRVPDEFALGHFVLDVRGGEVNGEEDQGEAHHVHGVCNYREL